MTMATLNGRSLCFLSVIFIIVLTLLAFKYYNVSLLNGIGNQNGDILTTELANSFREFSKNRPTNQQLDRGDDPILKLSLQNYVHTLSTRLGKPNCKKFKRFGNPNGDGGYYVCMDQAFKPDPTNCLVYSVGIRDEWSFDDDIANYGCEVHSFDPSMNTTDHMRSKNIHFHDLGYGGWDHVNHLGWKINTLASIIKKLGHQNRAIDVLKFDAEGAEWELFEELVGFNPVQLPTENRRLITESDSNRKREGEGEESAHRRVRTERKQKSENIPDSSAAENRNGIESVEENKPKQVYSLSGAIAGKKVPILRNFGKIALPFKQLLIEAHTPKLRINGKDLNSGDLYKIAYFLDDLDKEGGLSLVKNVQSNNCCRRFSDLQPPEFPQRCCHELFYVNRAFYKENKSV